MEQEDMIILKNGMSFERKIFSKYTENELEEVIKEAKSYVDVLNILKISINYFKKIKEFVKDNNINISHFEKIKKLPIKERLIKNSDPIPGPALKKYLLSNNIVKEECSVCNLPPIWNNKPLSLQVDHKNGDHFDNRVENLRLICPNCHTQTDTYTGRNLREYKEHKCECGKILKRNQTTEKCAECINKEKHLCSICKVNKRPGNWSKCLDCRKKPIEYKKCKGCGEDIKRQSNKGEYHKKCFRGIPLDKK